MSKKISSSSFRSTLAVALFVASSGSFLYSPAADAAGFFRNLLGWRSGTADTNSTQTGTEDQATVETEAIHQSVLDQDMGQAGLNRSEVTTVANRFRTDPDNFKALKELFDSAVSGSDAAARSLVTPYIKLAQSGSGGLSVYPLELKEINSRWPADKREAFAQALSRALAIKAADDSMSKQDALEKSLREVDLLQYYRARKNVLSLRMLSDIELGGSARTKLATLAQNEGVASGSFEQVMSDLYMKVSLGQGSALEKGERMAKLGNSLREVASSLPELSKRKVAYAVGMSVIRLEEFQREDFARRPFYLTQHPSYVTLDYTQYPEWTRSYVEGNGAYAAGSADAGVLGLVDIRDMMAHNLWPVGLRPHDTKHVHYATGHPQGPALTIQAARSRNALRTRLLGALYESVDTVQYGYERNISKYYRDRGMDIEQGLEEVAYADQETLNRIAADGARDSSFMSGVNDQLASYAPPMDSQYDGLGRSGTGYEAEQDRFVRDMTRLWANSANRPWMNYSQSMQSGAGSVSTDDLSTH